ncbi:MAG: hypothetical protein JWM63_1741, partial [Gammaproteobacteria bacterium]|nr:hypothetical protein [Gammaproteobacteria bacterium]
RHLRQKDEIAVVVPYMLNEPVPVAAKGFPLIVKLTDRDSHDETSAAHNVPPRNRRDGRRAPLSNEHSHPSCSGDRLTGSTATVTEESRRILFGQTATR